VRSMASNYTKNRVIKFAIVVIWLLLIFTLTACGEKMPTECPDYIDLSLDRELALLEQMAGNSEHIDLVPEDAFRLFNNSSQNGSMGDRGAIYIKDNVLYLVDYRYREVEDVLYKYVTKMAVRDGDKYIYKVDNWSGEGLQVAKYNNTYYDYFNKYKESQGIPTATPPESRKDTYPLLPDHIDHSGKRQLEQLNRVLEADFINADDRNELARSFIPEDAFLCGVSVKENFVKIFYVTADGVYYADQYESDLFDGKYGKSVAIQARKATDNYVYSIALNEKGECIYTYYPPLRYVPVGIECLDEWRKSRGLVPQPNPSEFSSLIYRGNLNPEMYME